ncbi:HNH endonuclease [Streptomyces sp. NPDC058066]|uniref:HNH endonuclease n=1 Tax=Streptomyces sp. NPDC058066 TaxID=3346323 RepID=UPI0036E6FEBD
MLDLRPQHPRQRRRPPAPLAFTLDHLVPLSLGGDLLDPANARSAHRRCNSARGNRATVKQPQRGSRRW